MEIVLNPLDEEKLYRVVHYTDGIAGSLQVREPCNFDGNRVLSRPIEYLGFTQFQTNRGAVTVQFGIEASTLREAFEKWPDLAKATIKKSVEDLQSQSLRQSIISPGRKKT